MLNWRYILPIGTLLTVLCFPPQASARTAPRRGAAHKPRPFEIQVPFPCGTEVRVTCSYGKRAHKRIKHKVSTNDFYALDMVRNKSNNGAREPVVAVASGVIKKAGWAKRGLAAYGRMVYIEHDYRDRRGKKYYTLYAHLTRVSVKVGQRVRKGQQIGTLGGSSKHKQRVFGPHLHFAMYRGAKPYLGGGRAVVPEPMGAWEDLRSRKHMVACEAPAPLPVASLFEGTDAVGGLTP